VAPEVSRTPRLLSYSEIETALTCWARWDFAYGGRLAGSTLKQRGLIPVLGEGRAWGAAVASWHQNAGKLTAEWEAHQALLAQIDKDVQEQAEMGFFPDALQRLETETRLALQLDLYMQTAEQLPNLTRIEEEIVVPIPSRGGKRASTHYRFLCYLDGFTDDNGMRWLVEFKLRNQLQPVEVIELSRQIRWYAWALHQQGSKEPLGVLVDQSLNDPPKPAKILATGKVSHQKAQVTTPQLYIDACLEREEEPKQDVIDHLGSRRWNQRVPLVFRPEELEEAGQELVSAAKLIRDLDHGDLFPIRNATKMHCSYCKFRRICANPTDDLVVGSMFERTVPKRLRPPKEKTANG
jgi:CRISPR/Cas system-associated exonuclease Cas4 (RecB family)